MSQAFAHFVFNLALGHTAFGNQAAAVFLKIQMAKAVPRRSFDSGFAVGSDIITPIGINELSAVITAPILQGCFLFLYTVLVVIADQIVLGLLTACTKIGNKLIQDLLLNGTIHRHIPRTTSLGVDKVKLLIAERIFQLIQTECSGFFKAQAEVSAKVSDNDYVVAFHRISDLNHIVKFFGQERTVKFVVVLF